MRLFQFFFFKLGPMTWKRGGGGGGGGAFRRLSENAGIQGSTGPASARPPHRHPRPGAVPRALEPHAPSQRRSRGGVAVQVSDEVVRFANKSGMRVVARLWWRWIREVSSLAQSWS